MSESVDGEPGANITRNENTLPFPRRQMVWWNRSRGFMMKSRLLKIWHASEKRVGSVPRGSPWDRWGRLLALRSDAIRRRGWLGRPGGNESTQHGRKCVPIICRFVSLSGGGWITVHYQWWQSEKLHCGDFPGFLISFISAGISASQRTALPEFTFALPLAPLLAAVLFFPRPIPPFFFFFRNPSTPHCWETDRDDCEGHQRRAVSHGGAFTLLHVSWPFSWGSWKLLCAASVNTGRLCSSTSDPHSRCGVEEKRFFLCAHARVCVSVPLDRALTLVLILIIVEWANRLLNHVCLELLNN